MNKTKGQFIPKIVLFEKNNTQLMKRTNINPIANHLFNNRFTAFPQTTLNIINLKQKLEKSG
jgi:hypothetical protein